MPDPPHSSRSVPVFPDPSLTLHSPWSPDFFVPSPLHTQRCRGAPEWAQTCPHVPVWRWDHKTEQQGDLVLQSHCVVVSVSIPRTEDDRSLRPKYPYFLRRQKGKRQSI